MDSKVIRLFGNDEEQYAKMLSEIIHQFKDVFNGFDDFGTAEILMFSWNLAIISKELDEEECLDIFDGNSEENLDPEVLNKIIAFKLKQFPNHNQYIISCNYDGESKNKNIDVKLGDIDDFNEMLLETNEEGLEEFDNFMNLLDQDFLDSQNFPGYINRGILFLQPKLPFKEWIQSVSSEFLIENISREKSFYLIKEFKGTNEAWLKKHFRSFFEMELDKWITNKEKWPKKRDLKTFKSWFTISLSNEVYDVEKTGIDKE